MLANLVPAPLVSILICTCNRQDNVVPTIQSIRSSGFADFELLVLDQSSDDATENAVRDLAGDDGRIRYVRLDRPSKPRALNQGRRLAHGQYLLLTDDDCEVKPGWAEAIVRTFEESPRTACVLGDVDAGPCDPNEGYIPACRIREARTISTLSEFLIMPGWQNFGIGANMALRASAIAEIGGWDPCIGPGARFRSGDDHDVIARLLVAGHSVAFCPDAKAVHYGMRRWPQVGDDQARYGYGMGAAFAKHLRLGTYYPGPLRLFGQGLVNSARSLWEGKRPLGLAYPGRWMRGLWEGLRQPLHRDTVCFVKTPDDVSGTSRFADIVLRHAQDSIPDVAEG